MTATLALTLGTAGTAAAGEAPGTDLIQQVTGPICSVPLIAGVCPVINDNMPWG